MTPENTQILRMTAAIVLGIGAAFGGMVAREKTSPVASESLLNSLVASKNYEPIPEDDYFIELSKLLKQDYVDPVEDEMKLATGAVRGMVGSLRDLHSIYYEKEDFQLVLQALEGKYQGIGADLAFEFPPAKSETDGQDIPRVVVLSVVPGGPANRAGVLPGDWIDSIDNRWVVNSRFIDNVIDVQQKVQQKRLPASAFIAIRRELRQKMENAIPPMRAWKRMMSGDNGTVRVKFIRGANPIEISITKARSERKPEADSMRLSFAPGSDVRLSPPSGPLRIDLRGAVGGDYQTAVGLLRKLGASGQLGHLKREARTSVPLTVKADTKPVTTTILVDKQTRGTAEAFALAMRNAGATVLGQSAGSPIATEVAMLPDGSGFTLNLGKFERRVK